MSAKPLTLPRAFCATCGHPVRLVRDASGEWNHGRCKHHPEALRMTVGYVLKKLAEMRAAVEAAPDINHWRTAR